MGRDVKRYFWYFHSFLYPRASVVLRQRRLSEAEACPAGAGGAPAGTGKLALELERTRICGAEPRWRRLLFPGSGGRTARVNGIVAVARVAHRSGIEMTIPCAWIRVSSELTPSVKMDLAWI